MKAIVILLLFVSLTANEPTTDNEVTKIDDGDGDGEVQKPLVMRSVDEHPNLPKETQMAQCTVQSGDIKASAQVSFSKKLEGFERFCSTDDVKMLRESLLDMESRLYRDIYNLQQLIQSVLPASARQYLQPPPPPPPPRDYYQTRNPYNQQSSNREQQETITTTKTQPITNTSTVVPPAPAAAQTKAPTVIKLKSLEQTSRNKRPQKQQKQQEKEKEEDKPVEKTEKITPKNEYTYYWKLDQFPKVFQNARKHEIFSHVFNVKGLYLRIRAHMNYMDSESLLLDIEHLANVENSEKLEIEISDGLVFKEIAEEKLFQYNFAILNQANPNHDLISPVYWNNENENFVIPNGIHLLSSYVKDHSILIKLVISF